MTDKDKAVAVLNDLYERELVSLYKSVSGFDYRIHIGGATTPADVVASVDAQRARLALGILFEGEAIRCREAVRPTGGYDWIARLQWEQAHSLLNAGVDVPHKDHILALLAAASH